MSIHVSPSNNNSPAAAVTPAEERQRLLETLEARSEESAALRVNIQHLRTQLAYAESRLKQRRTEAWVNVACGFVLGAITTAAVWIGSVIQ